jgi:hypothetical protein
MLNECVPHVRLDCALDIGASSRQDAFPFFRLDDQISPAAASTLLRFIVGLFSLGPTGIECEYSERALQLNCAKVANEFLHDG